MSSRLILYVFLAVNQLRLVDLQINRMVSPNMTCVSLPLAALSSRSDDRFSQLKLFAPPQFISNYTASCGKLDVYVLRYSLVLAILATLFLAVARRTPRMRSQ